MTERHFQTAITFALLVSVSTTPEMGQTQRVGLAPDIEVYPTIEGIKQGRDELMEAAIAYIQEQSQSATAAE